MSDTPSDPKTQLIDNLKGLHLPAMRGGFEEVARIAQQESRSYERYLPELTERECQARRGDRIERSLRDSRLPLEKTLGSLDLKRLPVKVVQRVRALLDGAFADRRENVLAFGNPGSGKTHVLSATSHELIRLGRRVYFRNCGLMVQDLLAAKRDLKLSGLFKKLSRYEVLVLDDLGYVQQSREEMEVLFSLLSERYERGSVMLSSNLAFSGWGAIFKDAMMTAAAIDRLVHHCVIAELNVPSYRVEHAKKGRPAPAATE
jgi:DNA replication protein DnaC